MALVSPGVEVTIIDESQYLPAPTNSIPFILLATAQNKADPTSTAVAAGTTAANANKLFRVTSQRDLVTLYGNPFFYTTSNGVPIQGYELNALKGSINTLKNIEYILTEFNVIEMYDGCPSIEQLDEFLQPFGFYRQETWNVDGVWGDAFYLKKI